MSVGLFLDYDVVEGINVFRNASYLSGSGTDTIVLGYTVRPGDSAPNGVGLILGTERTGLGGDGAVKAKGTNVEMNPNYPWHGPSVGPQG